MIVSVDSGRCGPCPSIAPIGRTTIRVSIESWYSGHVMRSTRIGVLLQAQALARGVLGVADPAETRGRRRATGTASQVQEVLLVPTAEPGLTREPPLGVEVQLEAV